MAKPTSATNRSSRQARRGFTLVESLIASTMLSVSVVGVTGTVLSSYENDAFSQTQSDALRAGAQMMDEFTGLPMDSPSSDNVGVNSYAAYADRVGAWDTLPVLTAVSTQASVVDRTVNGVAGIVGSVLEEVVAGADEEPSPAAPSSSSAPAVTRTVGVERRSTLGGGTVSNGDLAIITVALTTADGRTIKLKRLVTSAEAAANAKKS